ncbi:MAG: NAD-dependent epimerase/dehydratase family protein [bacterium]|nr:NAD-dependent epimerase/dehydratase family protein [bacterium]
MKKILVLGIDGYLGWPTAMRFSQLGYEVAGVDNMAKRGWEDEVGAKPLWPVPTLQKRVRVWEKVSGKKIRVFVGDITGGRFIYKVFEDFRPDVVIHYAEQPSAPYSMKNRQHAVFTQENNVSGTLNVIHAMMSFCPKAHLVKLGTMGEYGTPNIDIEEGWLDIEHNGRKDRMMFPKRPGSFYHLSKVHDSHNIEFCCRVWGLRATDLNQGVVYGIATDETELHPELLTSFHYDSDFGTALNRFCVEAVAGVPLTVYGNGGQKRGFLNIRDTLQCVQIATENPAESGEFRVFNQFTEVFSVTELAKLVQSGAKELGLSVKIANLPNPRVESEAHHYNPKNDSLLKLGLQPNMLSGELVDSMLRKIQDARELIDLEVIHPKTKWKR